MRPIVFAFALSLAAIVPSLCIAAPTISVVAAENFYGDLAKQIGGKHVDVSSILSNPDDDPHLFEVSPSTARALSHAQIVIYNGVDYDPWMDKLLAVSGEAGRSVIVAAKLIGAKKGDNPHLWYDPATFPAVADALEADLAKRDPADAADFRANLAAFKQSFARVVGQISEIKAKNKGTVVTATEPVFGYMAQALGFTMLNYPFQVAIMNDAEPSPSQVAAFETSLKSGKVKILFYNRQVTDRTTEHLLALAKADKVAVIGVSETEPKGEDIQQWFGGQLDEIRHVLDGHAT